jgi:hypothetical protein
MLTLWEAPSQEARADHNDDKLPQTSQAVGHCSLDQDGFRRVADGLTLGYTCHHARDDSTMTSAGCASTPYR